MGNIIDLPNVNFDELARIEAEQNSKTNVYSKKFDTKNYLNIRLDEGETQKTLKIRLLPNPGEKGNSPFIKVHTHNLKNLPKEVASSGYKSYICLEKSPIDHSIYGNKCPICEMKRKSYQESEEETDPQKKKCLQDLAFSCLPTETVIMRVILRDKEDEGPKFLKVNVSKRKDDLYSLIHMLGEQLYNTDKENIYDVVNGRDLTLTITRSPNEKDKKMCYSVTPSLKASPLHPDLEVALGWINDEKKWNDVFGIKPYEYLSIISAGEIPWYDKSIEKWVPKRDNDSAEPIPDITPNYDQEFVNEVTNSTSTSQPNNNVDISVSTVQDEDDLPF